MLIENTDINPSLYTPEYCPAECRSKMHAVYGIELAVAIFATAGVGIILRRQLRNAYTPEKRLGAFLLTVAAVFLGASLVYWTATTHAPIYASSETSIVRDATILEPTSSPEGTQWEKSIYNIGWVLFDTECKAKLSQIKPVMLQSDYAECRRDYVLAEKVLNEVRIESSMDELMDNTMMTSWIGLTALLAILGAALRCNLWLRFRNWIRHGANGHDGTN